MKSTSTSTHLHIDSNGSRPKPLIKRIIKRLESKKSLRPGDMTFLVGLMRDVLEGNEKSSWKVKTVRGDARSALLIRASEPSPTKPLGSRKAKASKKKTKKDPLSEVETLDYTPSSAKAELEKAKAEEERIERRAAAGKAYMYFEPPPSASPSVASKIPQRASSERRPRRQTGKVPNFENQAGFVNMKTGRPLGLGPGMFDRLNLGSS